MAKKKMAATKKSSKSNGEMLRQPAESQYVAELDALVKADTHVDYGRVVTAMVLLQQAGAEQLGFLTDPLETPPVIRE